MSVIEGKSKCHDRKGTTIDACYMLIIHFLSYTLLVPGWKICLEEGAENIPQRFWSMLTSQRHTVEQP